MELKRIFPNEQAFQQGFVRSDRQFVRLAQYD